MPAVFTRTSRNPACTTHYPQPRKDCVRCTENLATLAALREERKRRAFRPHGVVEAPGGRSFRCQLPRGHDGICKGKMLPPRKPKLPVAAVVATMHGDAGRIVVRPAYDDLPF